MWLGLGLRNRVRVRADLVGGLFSHELLEVVCGASEVLDLLQHAASLVVDVRVLGTPQHLRVWVEVGV